MSFSEIYAGWRARLEKLIDFILDTDPILTDDGLAGFMEEHVPK